MSADSSPLLYPPSNSGISYRPATGGPAYTDGDHGNDVDLKLGDAVLLGLQRREKKLWMWACPHVVSFENEEKEVQFRHTSLQKWEHDMGPFFFFRDREHAVDRFEEDPAG